MIAKKLGDLRISCVRHIAEPWPFAGSGDRRQISLGPVARPVDAVTTGSAATLVGLHQRPAYDLLERRRGTPQLVPGVAQRRRRSLCHSLRTESVLCPIDSELESLVKLHFLRFKEPTSSSTASTPRVSTSTGRWPLIGSTEGPGGAQSVQSRGIASEPISVWRRLKISTPETFLTFRTVNRWPRSG